VSDSSPTTTMIPVYVHQLNSASGFPQYPLLHAASLPEFASEVALSESGVEKKYNVVVRHEINVKAAVGTQGCILANER